jgi:5-methylcytosine-specific restriction endonuclease McrA
MWYTLGRMEKDITGDNLLVLFRHNCITLMASCTQHTSAIHEIIPKSKGKGWNRPRNRVPLCPTCHGWVHNVIGTKQAAAKIEEARQLRMVQLGISWKEIDTCAEQL